MLDLFDDVPKPDIDWYPNCLTPAVAADSLRQLTDEVAWRQDWINTPRGRIPLPRLTAWQGDPDVVYVYSGIVNMPARWTPTVLALRRIVERVAVTRFNSVLLNRYRHGKDGMGWHADDEASLGQQPIIGSLSLGAARTFELRHNATGVMHRLRLTSGSLLVMRGRTQAEWKHRVPKAAGLAAERLNLTFRWIEPTQRTAAGRA
ncbi:alpha-ketoglutarate-dependent dioxygenase AlkB [Mycetohabitans sp. B5]|uniref:DNA-N1-methyladenine dioxygenase n=1 Tax=Mycetohabitans endofungorum TaxID=417203 RepID=A0A2P5KAD5_9BURK|nr:MULTISPECIES: alpha-ketoglutarate-dependent dioxygenase AlkB [Mycetohabitans]MCG1055019.1 alpha-ketoglutarate-dependent dioxygenase AlkB [Mycetohabitans sp. B5]PPB83669.1 DNA-N1-methyladenine dioxygenase [Mycetohabitans endofungorum]